MRMLVAVVYYGSVIYVKQPTYLLNTPCKISSKYYNDSSPRHHLLKPSVLLFLYPKTYAGCLHHSFF